MMSLRTPVRLKATTVPGVSSSVIFGALPLQKCDGSPQLVEPVHAVFDRDPPGEPRVGQDAKDRVVVDHALSDLSVLQLVRIAERAVGLPQLVERGARCNISI